AMAHAVPVLHGDELHTLQEGEAMRGGNMALIAAGTGLGQALLHQVDGRFVPSPSEAGRAEVERVVSGQGLVNLHRVTHEGTCLGLVNEDAPDAPAAISSAALARR